MSRVQVVTDDHAFAEQVADALLAKLMQRLPGLLSSAQAESERLMTPSEVRDLKRCRFSRVLDALAHGQLPATRRPTKGGKLGWFIRAADAARWDPDRTLHTLTPTPPTTGTEVS
jgi:hypothetical protein